MNKDDLTEDERSYNYQDQLKHEDDLFGSRKSVTMCKYCEKKEASNTWGDYCSQLCYFYSVTKWTDDEILEELSRPSTHRIDHFAFHVLKEATARILERLPKGDTQT